MPYAAVRGGQFEEVAVQAARERPTPEPSSAADGRGINILRGLREDDLVVPARRLAGVVDRRAVQRAFDRVIDTDLRHDDFAG